MGSVSSSMGSSCPLAIPLLSQSKSTDFKGVILDLHKSAEIPVSVWKTDWCGDIWRVVALCCTVGITCPKSEGQNLEGLPPHSMWEIPWYWCFCHASAGLAEERLTGWWWSIATSGRLMSVGTCPEPHRGKGSAEGSWNLCPPLQISP